MADGKSVKSRFWRKSMAPLFEASTSARRPPTAPPRPPGAGARSALPECPLPSLSAQNAVCQRLANARGRRRGRRRCRKIEAVAAGMLHLGAGAQRTKPRPRVPTLESFDPPRGVKLHDAPIRQGPAGTACRLIPARKKENPSTIRRWSADDVCTVLRSGAALDRRRNKRRAAKLSSRFPPFASCLAQSLQLTLERWFVSGE